jgi:hypothetical protein
MFFSNIREAILIIKRWLAYRRKINNLSGDIDMGSTLAVGKK